MARPSSVALILIVVAMMLIGFTIAHSPAPSPTKSPAPIASPTSISPESATSPMNDNYFPSSVSNSPAEAPEPLDNGSAVLNRLGRLRGSFAIGIVAAALVL